MPVTYLAFSFGGYVYASGAGPGGNTPATAEESSAFRAQSSTAPGRGGRYTAGSLLDGYRLTLTGVVEAATPSNPGSIRAAWDTFKAAHRPGPPRQFMVDSDRYLNAEVESELKAQAWDGLPHRAYALTLASFDDPPWFAATATTQALAAGATTFTPADPNGVLATGCCDPVITAVISAAPAGGALSITDAAGNHFTLSPTAIGTWAMDSLQEQVTLAGVQVAAGYTGEFLRLVPGSNTLTVAATGGLALTSVSLSYQARWY